MTKEQLLKLPPGTLLDITTNGVFCGTREWSHFSDDGFAFVREVYGSSCHLPWELSIHVPQPQVSGPIETQGKGLCDNTPELHACCMEKDPPHNVAKCSCGASALLYPHLKNTVPAKVTSIDDEKLVLHPKEETPPKLYTFSMGNATPATEEQIMAQECVEYTLAVASSDWTRIKGKADDLAARLETAHEQERRLGDSNLRMAQRLAELEAPPTDADITKAYNALLAGGYEDEARVLQTLSHVVDRMADEIEAKNGRRN